MRKPRTTWGLVSYFFHLGRSRARSPVALIGTSRRVVKARRVLAGGLIARAAVVPAQPSRDWVSGQTGRGAENMRLQFPVYDALYAYCRTGRA